MKLELDRIEQGIIDYMKSNFTPEGFTLDWVKDDWDLDRYKKSDTMFLKFTNIDMDNLTRATSDMALGMTIGIACRNGKIQDITERALKLGNCFYNFFYEDRCLGGIVDTGRITSMEHVDEMLYSGVAVFKVNIQFNVEV